MRAPWLPALLVVACSAAPTAPTPPRSDAAPDAGDVIAPDVVVAEASVDGSPEVGAPDVAAPDVAAPDDVAADAPVDAPRDVATTTGPAAPVVYYADSAGDERALTALALSDGTWLVAGGADSLAWVPAAAARSELALSGIAGSPGGARRAYIAQLSRDLATVLRVVALPAGAAFDVRHLRVTSAPGEATGALYISGTTTESRAGGAGTFLARLDGNFVTRVPTRAEWVRNWWASGTHRTAQPWDVGGDGKVVYATGSPFGTDWSAVYRLRADGTDDVVEDWRYHWGTRADGRAVEGGWTPASSRGDVTVRQSAVVFKTQGRCDLRSWTMADYAARTPDGNGGTRQGTWPLDLLFSGPCDPAAPTANGPGYTGYRMGANPTLQVGAIAVDRRTRAMYLGFSVQSRLPDGQPDFEPGVIAMSETGRVTWWSRLYTETPRNSTPDQYVDRLAVDPATGELVVLARCHGNNVDNLWPGDGVAARPGATAFHNRFTGTSGNIHVSWLGRFDARGTLRAASYLAEYADGMTGTGAPYADPLLDGWPSHNAGWPELNTTRAESLAVDARGRVAVIATGRRTVTTRNAFMRMPQRAMGASGWNDFARVYAPDLSTVTYSSILRGPWDPSADGGGANVRLVQVVPADNGVLAVGYHLVDASGAALGQPMPTAQVPAWGSARPTREAIVVAWLPW